MDIEEHLAALRARPFEVTDKVFGGLAGQTPAGLAGGLPPLHQAGLSYPLLALRESALRNNAEQMAAYCTTHGVDLAPHGKTGMSPELAALQLRHGAWAITAATPSQLRAYRAFGHTRLLLANELTDPAAVAWLAADPTLTAYFYMDTTDVVSLPPPSLPGRSQRLPVLVEIGPEHTRTGCRTDAEAIAVAQAIAASGTFRVAGVAAYEGGEHGPGAVDRVTALCRRLRRLADVLRDTVPQDHGDGPAEFIVTAGGSIWFDVVTDELTAGDTSGLRIVLRSGAYLYYDQGIYARNSPQGRGVPGAPQFQPAIELWAQVLSRPEPDLALLGLGRRDAGIDAGLPKPAVAGWEIVRLDDQHAYLRLPPEAVLGPGDLVCLGISHPCTTLDKWPLIPLVDEDGRISDVVHTFF